MNDIPQCKTEYLRSHDGMHMQPDIFDPALDDLDPHSLVLEDSYSSQLIIHCCYVTACNATVTLPDLGCGMTLHSKAYP